MKPIATCSEEGCSRPVERRDLCKSCYERRRITGTLPLIPCPVTSCPNGHHRRGPCEDHRNEFASTGLKWCTADGCDQPLKPLTEFAKKTDSSDGRHSRCKICVNRYQNDHRISTRALRSAYLSNRRAENPGFAHGLPDGVYWQMLADQGALCPICSKQLDRDARASTPCIDHDHSHCPGETGCSICVRSLLCNGCNQLLGKAHDDPAILRRWKPTRSYSQERINAAIAYLEYWHAEMAKRGIRPPLDEALWRDALNALSRLVTEIA